MAARQGGVQWGGAGNSGGAKQRVRECLSPWGPHLKNGARDAARQQEVTIEEAFHSLFSMPLGL